MKSEEGEASGWRRR